MEGNSPPAHKSLTTSFSVDLHFPNVYVCNTNKQNWKKHRKVDVSLDYKSFLVDLQHVAEDTNAFKKDSAPQKGGRGKIIQRHDYSLRQELNHEAFDSAVDEDSTDLDISTRIININQDHKDSIGVQLDGGDIAIPSTGSDKRGTLDRRYRLWPKDNDKVTVPYILDNTARNRGIAKTAILAAIEYMNGIRGNCIEIVPRTSETDYIKFTSRSNDGCWSYISIIGGEQEISISPGCHYVGIVVHEIFHALGVFHEQSRPDRDEFVEIKYENIPDDARGNFEKEDAITSAGKAEGKSAGLYDYTSVMHYGAKDFSINGQATIVPRMRDAVIGQIFGMSKSDFQQLMLLYDCPVPAFGSDDCDFDESGLCHYSATNAWKLSSVDLGGSFVSQYPKRDHTYGIGKYAKYHASEDRSSSDREMVSKVFSSSLQPQCVTFYYYMYNPDEANVAKLKVVLRVSGSDSVLDTFQSSGADEWVEGQVQVLKQSADFQISQLSDKYKEVTDWNRTQSGGNQRTCPHFDILDRVLGAKDVVNMPHVLEVGLEEGELSGIANVRENILHADLENDVGLEGQQDLAESAVEHVVSRPVSPEVVREINPQPDLNPQPPNIPVIQPPQKAQERRARNKPNGPGARNEADDMFAGFLKQGDDLLRIAERMENTNRRQVEAFEEFSRGFQALISSQMHGPRRSPRKNLSRHPPPDRSSESDEY